MASRSARSLACSTGRSRFGRASLSAALRPGRLRCLARVVMVATPSRFVVSILGGDAYAALRGTGHGDEEDIVRCTGQLVQDTRCVREAMPTIVASRATLVGLGHLRLPQSSPR